jgi:hypothetical protein
MKIAIPSYQRFNVLTGQTLSFLDKHKINKTDIYVFVREGDNELVEYQSLQDQGYHIIVCGCEVIGAGMKHNFITDYFDEGEFIIEIDDDLRDLIDEHKNPVLDFMKEMNIMKDMMIKDKINYGGIYACDNAFFMWGCKDKYNTDLRYMLGILRIRCICKDVKVKTNYAEDFEFCLRHFVRDGKILKNNHIGPKTKIYAKGGNDASGRNMETEKVDKELVHLEFPTLSRLFQRKNGRWDLRIKQYKT